MATWNGFHLECSQCKRILAFRYKINEEVRLYVYPEYESFRRKIESRKDNSEITCDGDLLGTTDFREFEKLLDSIKQRQDNIYTIPIDLDGFEETWESKVSCDVGVDDYIVE